MSDIPVIKFVRQYAHKTFGTIGSVKLEFAGLIAIDNQQLPEASMRALLNHGLQLLQDAYAGAKNADAAQKAFDEKLTKLLAGNFGSRNSADPVESKMWVLAEKALRGKGLKGKDLETALEAFMAKEDNLAKLRPIAEVALAQESDLLSGLAD